VATPVLLPKLDMTMAEGTLTRWHKQEGDPVAVGDLLFEVGADKLNMDIEATAAGVLRGVAYPDGSVLEVGTVVAYILAEGEALPAAADQRVRATPAARRIGRERGIELSEVPGTGPGGRVQAADVLAVPGNGGLEAGTAPAVAATPLARKVAAGLGVDLAGVEGTGVGGKVMKADVERTAAPVVPAPGPAEAGAAEGEPERVALKGARAVIARRMSESWHQSPHVTLTLEADCTDLVRLRSRLAGTVKLSYNTLVAYLTARALTAFPVLNTTWDGTDLLRHSSVHLAVAMDAPGGLLVPVIRQAERLGLQGLHETLGDLAARARGGGLSPGELAGGTFTLSNLGGFGIEAFTPVINPPQVAILGVGAIVDKAVPENGTVVIRPRMTLSLSFDHRALDGADGARFLAHLRSLIECPERVLL